MTSKSKKQCFVISPISKKGTAIRKRSDKVLKKIIEPAAQECDYNVIRADMIPNPGLITSQIIRHLLEDPLVIADLTKHNPNVLYELAFRHVLKKPVVQMIKDGQKLPFDVAAIRTIFYNDNKPKSFADSKKELVKQIRSVENDPTQVDAPFSPTIFPNTNFYTTEKEINKYMFKLISTGSTLDIVSNRLHWVSENSKIRSSLIMRADCGDEINIYLPKKNTTCNELKKHGVKIYVCADLGNSPHARFTLINKNIPGAATLAVGSPKPSGFMISEFSESANAQVVAMARDYVNTLMELSNLV